MNSREEEKVDEDEDKEKIKNQLRIAWRYGESPSSNIKQSISGGDYFLLNKYMSLNEADDVKLFKFDLNSDDFYKSLAIDLNKKLDSGFNITKLKQFTNILRIGNQY